MVKRESNTCEKLEFMMFEHELMMDLQDTHAKSSAFLKTYYLLWNESKCEWSPKWQLVMQILKHFWNLLSLIVQEQIWEISNTAMGHANLQYFWILIISYLTEQMWDLWNGNGSCKSSIFLKTHHLTVSSVLSLNNPQTTETNFCEKYEVGMLKIIIIMIGYTLNNFFTQMIIDHGKK